MTTPARPTPISIYPILSVNFIGALGFSIVLPFLVFLVTRLGGNALVYGVMGATYSAFQLIGAPMLGRWSDRFGRRRVLLVSQVGTLASWLIFFFALFLPVTPVINVENVVVGTFTITIPLAVLFVARALDGITGGNVSVANAYLADITPEERRSENFGKMAVASNMGFILGPAIAGALGATALGEVPPVLAAIVISAGASIVIMWKLPESSQCVLETYPEHANVRKMMGQEQKECYELSAAPSLSIREIGQLPSVPLLLTIYFLVFLAFNFFYIAFPIHAATRLQWTLTDTGVFFSAMGLMMAIVQGPVLKRASSMFADHVLVITGSVILALSFLFFLSPQMQLVYSGTALLALGNGLMWPSLLATLSKATDRTTQGAVQGLASSAGAIASITGLLVGGFLYEALGATIFALSTVIAGLVAVMGLSIRVPETLNEVDNDQSPRPRGGESSNGDYQ